MAAAVFADTLSIDPSRLDVLSFFKRPLGIILVLSALVLGATARVPADEAKVLQNQRGYVAHQQGQSPAVPLAASSSVSIDDGSVAITGADSLGAVVLPDSSQIILGANTRVQLSYFNYSQIATAKFVLYNGKTRFEIRHPRGALANYTFTTATGQIAVRGTDGDIESTQGTMRVNVYDLSDSTAPVQVTTIDGRTFTLRAGQTLFAHYVNGVLQVDVDNITQQAMSAFNQFGSPPPQGPQKPQKPQSGGPSGQRAAARRAVAQAQEDAAFVRRQAALAIVAIGIAILLMIESFLGRPIHTWSVRLNYRLGKIPTTRFARRRLAQRQIDLRIVGSVLLDPRRTRTQRDGRKRTWGFVEETGKWLRVVTLPDGTVHDAFFDREFKFEDRIRPRD
jgi:hypothetical protein